MGTTRRKARALKKKLTRPFKTSKGKNYLKLIEQGHLVIPPPDIFAVYVYEAVKSNLVGRLVYEKQREWGK